MDPILERYQALEEKVRSYSPHADFDKLSAAFHYADSHHSKQLRKDGSPFITHPLAVARNRDRAGSGPGFGCRRPASRHH